MRVSVVIPLYNMRRFVAQAIDSALSQTLAPLEVIVVDDGSTDDGVSVVEAMGRSEVRVVRQRNGGVSKARNAGIAAARGDWIAFLDADDVYEPHFLAHAADAVALHPRVGMVGARFHIVRGDDVVVKQAAPEPDLEPIADLHKRWMRGALFCTSSVLIRSETLRSLDEWFVAGESHGEDLDLFFRLSEKAPALLLRGKYVHHRVNVAGSLSSTNGVSIPPYLDRIVQRAASGAMPPAMVASAHWNVAQQKLTLARDMVALGHRGKAIECLLSTDHRGCTARWLLTAIMMFAPGELITRWQTYRVDRSGPV